MNFNVVLCFLFITSMIKVTVSDKCDECMIGCYAHCVTDCDCKATCNSQCESTRKRRQTIPDFCLLPPDSGMCFAFMPRYHYDDNANACKQFIYGGCGGNQNRFMTTARCMSTCHN